MKRMMAFAVTGVILSVSGAAAQEGPGADVLDPQLAGQLARMQAQVDISPQMALDIQTHVNTGLLFNWENFGGDGFDESYRAGTQAIDRHDYEAAIADMKRVIAAKSNHMDGALYWKAYAEFKLGRAKDALATLSELRKGYPHSSWLGDAKALELEARNQLGQPVLPESAGDEDLKLLALNGLMHSDPSRATPLIEKVVADAGNTPKLRERALFVLARSSAPDARQTVAKLAEGSANPDLQAKAIKYLAITDSQQDGAMFAGIYQRTTDPEVKRAALQALFLRKDGSDLSAIARSESNAELQREAVQFLGMTGGAASLLSLYQSGSNAALKRDIIDSLCNQNAAKQLVEIAQHESDPQLKHNAVERLSVMKDKAAADYMIELLGK
ncbi:MAG: HEAT repeat domain-containing protein [Bryobacteraceae bacterium]